ncbi:FAS1-like dehydratase domain-containing protein [Candidatus Protofrankia californiensis]|uniref:FAS1-like dehydratase domain-containing protein n=1 Tax=Candidatus Protofrankia californiensis TaxID=1839754 RepID=UPI0019D07892|nr:MaoC family dehydratase N-terminal domain-containing protein [Candidatus Protofrankia californiensis]
MGQRFPVEEGHVMAFARAVGEPMPSPERVVPPTFTATSIQHDPEHMRGMRPTGALAVAPVGGGELLHAEQHFEYLLPVHLGDVLDVTEEYGRRWTKNSKRGGKLLFTELVKELRNQHGAVVVRSRMVLVETPPTSASVDERPA